MKLAFGPVREIRTTLPIFFTVISDTINQEWGEVIIIFTIMPIVFAVLKININQSIYDETFYYFSTFSSVRNFMFRDGLRTAPAKDDLSGGGA
jgi:hypothetical protein